MERLKPTWFLEQPLDIEHKNYVLLDYLKKKSEDLGGDSVSSNLKEVSGIMKVLYSFKENGKVPEDALNDLDQKEREDLSKILIKIILILLFLNTLV